MNYYDLMCKAVFGSEISKENFGDAEDQKFYEDYVVWTNTTAKYPNPETNLMYPIFGFAGEAAELMDKCDGLYRDKGSISDENRLELDKELGDVFWYTARLSLYFDVPMFDLLVVACLMLDGTTQLARDLIKENKTDPYFVLWYFVSHLQRRFAGGLEALKKIERGDVDNDSEKRVNKVLLGLLGIVSMLSASMFTYSIAALKDVDLHNLTKTVFKDVCTLNQEKLMARLENETIKGDGDAR